MKLPKMPNPKKRKMNQLEILIVLAMCFAVIFLVFNSSEVGSEEPTILVKTDDGRIIRVMSQDEFIEEFSSFDRKGSSNPALRFRDISTGNVVYYFDHSGKIVAFNMTLAQNLNISGNLTVINSTFLSTLNVTTLLNESQIQDIYILNSGDTFTGPAVFDSGFNSSGNINIVLNDTNITWGDNTQCTKGWNGSCLLTTCDGNPVMCIGSTG